MYNPNFKENLSFVRMFGVEGQNTVNGNQPPNSGINPITKIGVASQHSNLPDIYSYTGTRIKVD